MLREQNYKKQFQSQSFCFKKSNKHLITVTLLLQTKLSSKLLVSFETGTLDYNFQNYQSTHWLTSLTSTTRSNLILFHLAVSEDPLNFTKNQIFTLWHSEDQENMLLSVFHEVYYRWTTVTEISVNSFRIYQWTHSHCLKLNFTLNTIVIPSVYLKKYYKWREAHSYYHDNEKNLFLQMTERIMGKN